MFIRNFQTSAGTYQALVRSRWHKGKQQSRQSVVKWLGRVSSVVTWTHNDAGECEQVEFGSFRQSETAFLCDALQRRRSLLLHGAWGVGKTYVAEQVAARLRGAGLRVCLVRSASPAGQFVAAMADALGLDLMTENDNGKPRKKPQADVLAEIGDALTTDEKTVLIVDKAQSIPVTLRNYFELWHERGATLLLCATLPRRAELFLKFTRYELKPLPQLAAKQFVSAACAVWRVSLTPSERAEVLAHGNGNPQFLLRGLYERELSLVSEPDQTEWIDGTPLVIAALVGLIALRYVGRGLGSEALMIAGGVAFAVLRLMRLTLRRGNRNSRTIGERQ